MRSNLWLILSLWAIVPISPSLAQAPSDLFSELPEPGGVLVGMTLADAKRALASNGYEQTSNCDYEAPRPDGNGFAARITLTVQSRGSVTGNVDTRNPLGESVAASTCASDEHRVTKIRWFRSAGAERVDPDAEFAGLTRRFGATTPIHGASCGNSMYNGCLFRQLPRTPEIERMTVTIQPNMGRAEIFADPQQIWPPDPARAGEFDSATQKAASICQQAGQSAQGRRAGLHALVDCACVADRVAREYVIGMRNTIDEGAIYTNSDYCPNPDTAAIEEYFADDCAQTKARMDVAAMAWNDDGGCECVAEHATEAFLKDPRLISMRQRPDSSRECGFYDRGERYAAAATSNLNSDMMTVTLVQQQLVIKTHSQLTPSGIYDDQTRMAIIEFEAANQMPVTGNVTTELLEALRQAPPRPH